MRNAAFRVLQIGAIAAVLVVSAQTIFDLDRFLVPKELVLHATAVIAALLAFGALRQLEFRRADWLLVIYLAISAVSAALATNRWIAFRAFALSASAILIFWTARALADRRLINALAIAVVLASMTSLLETYGLRLTIFASSRVPGGTLGNRNFIAHIAAIGLPLLFSIAIRNGKFLMPSIGVAIVTASLVLTRSRAAWIAAAVMLVVFVIFSKSWARMAAILGFAIAGAVAALVIPNTLEWRSGNPYLRSVTDIANYQQGSGRGRLVQYSRSLVMAVHHPIFGVGPGNWPVIYPHFAARNDPSVNGGDNMTFNPWPSSDWIAFVSERGGAATIVLFLALTMLAVESRDAAATAVVAAAIVAGLFDAVLLLPVPAMIVFAALGALRGGQAIAPVQPVERIAPRPGRIAAPPLVLIVIAVLGAYRSGAQLAAMELYDQPRVAAKVDPGNYRIQKRVHARAAHELFPYAR